MNKKDIAIVTFHSAINYGAALQAVALQRKIEALDGKCEILDYRNEKFEKQYGIQKKFNTTNKMKKIFLFIIKNFLFIIKKIKFKHFLKRYGKISRKKYNKNNISMSNERYYKFITGSDQVFNLEITNNDENYFLDFIKDSKRKFSYAASYGNAEISEKNMKKYEKLLESFNSLSLREHVGAEMTKKLFSKEINVNIDPTLLMNGSDWEKICKLKRNNKKYILFYKVATPVDLVSFVKRFAKEKGCEVIEIGSNLKSSDKTFKYSIIKGPIEFLSLIFNAEYVATTSFHGTVFSLLFHKKLILEMEDINKKFNTRVKNLLDLVGISLHNENKISCAFDVDWDKVDFSIEKERNEAEIYLRRIIEEQ